MRRTLIALLYLTAVGLIGCAPAQNGFGIVFLYGPDGVQGPQGIYRISNSAQDKIEQIADVPDRSVDYAMLSPKRDSIVFGTRYPDRIYLLNLNTKKVKNITDSFATKEFGSGLTYPVAWSPDQKQVAFLSGKRGALGILDIDGGKYEYLDLPSFGSLPQVAAVNWSPDGTELAFSHTTDMSRPVVHVAAFLYKLSSKDLIQLTSYDEDCGGPLFSPTGKQILVTCKPFDYSAPAPNIYIINASNSNERVLVSDTHSCNYPAWSPDGKQIVYECMQGKSFGIFTIRSSGTGRHQVGVANLADFAFVEYPIWSPDGRQIIYVAGDDWQHTNIYSVNVDGSNNHPLTHQLAYYEVVSVYAMP